MPAATNPTYDDLDRLVGRRLRMLTVYDAAVQQLIAGAQGLPGQAVAAHKGKTIKALEQVFATIEATALEIATLSDQILQLDPLSMVDPDHTEEAISPNVKPKRPRG